MTPEEKISKKRKYDRESSNRYRQRNLEKMRKKGREAARRRRLRDPEGTRRYNTEWARKNKDKISITKKKQYKKYREIYLAKNKKQRRSF